MKKLVAYYSRTGNTRFVAEEIAKHLSADLCEIKDKRNREGSLTYLTGGFASFRERLTDIDVTTSVEEYDCIIVGSPIWGGKISPATRKFLVSNDFTDKVVAFFVTLGGNKPEKSLTNLKKAVKVKIFAGELAVSRALEKQQETKTQVSEWCTQIRNQLMTK